MDDGSIVLLVFLAIWLLLGWLVGRFSAEKGHGFTQGFLLSLLLSPVLAAIIVAIVPKPKGIQRDCPYCTERIPIKAIRCRYCQADLTAPHSLSSNGETRREDRSLPVF